MVGLPSLPSEPRAYLSEYNHGLVQGVVGTLIVCIVASLLFYFGTHEEPQTKIKYYPVVFTTEKIHEMIDLHQLRGYTPPLKDNELRETLDDHRHRPQRTIRR